MPTANAPNEKQKNDKRDYHAFRVRIFIPLHQPATKKKNRKGRRGRKEKKRERKEERRREKVKRMKGEVKEKEKVN